MDKKFEDLQRAYVEELGAARDTALVWWNDLLMRADQSDPIAANKAVRPRWPAGPVSYPGVIAVFRKYWLACEALNERHEAEAAPRPSAGWGEDDENKDREATDPRSLLLDGLEPIDAELSQFINELPYSPIGTDDEGESA